MFDIWQIDTVPPGACRFRAARRLERLSGRRHMLQYNLQKLKIALFNDCAGPPKGSHHALDGSGIWFEKLSPRARHFSQNRNTSTAVSPAHQLNTGITSICCHSQIIIVSIHPSKHHTSRITTVSSIIASSTVVVLIANQPSTMATIVFLAAFAVNQTFFILFVGSLYHD